MSGLSIRAGVPGDADLVFALLHELAVYEKLEDKFRLTREALTRLAHS